jgi:hypothetical protein
MPKHTHVYTITQSQNWVDNEGLRFLRERERKRDQAKKESRNKTAQKSPMKNKNKI